jgi:hypothetical protein
VQKTLHRVHTNFFIPSARVLVQDFVRTYSMCQRNKTEQLHPAGLLQPLEVPSTVWTDVAMEFVEGFPHVHGKSVVLIVIDRFSKCAHYITLGHPYMVTSVARVFFAEIVRLHGLPNSFVSNRNATFTSTFW